VNIGTAHADWLQSPPSSDWTGCVESRGGSYAVSDDPPSVQEFSPAPRHYRYYGRDLPLVCPRTLLPLTTTKSDLVQYVNANLVPDGGTRIDMGLRWGWRVISPRWQGLWGSAETPKQTETGLVKSVVLMTDGQNDTGPYDEVTKSQADANVTSLCTTMKQQGIVIYTVMFSACASKPEYFFETVSATQLRDAFKNIGGLINKPKLVH
jgi:hypothetical protein